MQPAYKDLKTGRQIKPSKTTKDTTQLVMDCVLYFSSTGDVVRCLDRCFIGKQRRRDFAANDCKQRSTNGTTNGTFLTESMKRRKQAGIMMLKTLRVQHKELIWTGDFVSSSLRINDNPLIKNEEGQYLDTIWTEHQ